MDFVTMLLAATTLYVAPDGNDMNDGSRARPFKTAQRAVDAARAVMRDETKTIVFTDGYHFFDRCTDVRGDRDLTFKAEHPRKAVLSGAVKVTGWKSDPKDARFLVAEFPFEPKQETLYTLIVNAKLADFSSYPQLGGTKKLRYPATEEDTRKNNRTVFEYDPADLPDGGDYRDLDIASAYVFIPQEWASTTSYIATNDWQHNTFYLKGRTDMPLGRFNTGYQIMNTRFGLKAPGTWMFEATKRQIVYWPREGETAEKLDAYVSCQPSLFDVGGSKYVRFEGLVMEGCSSSFHANPYSSKVIQAVIGGGGPKFLTIDNCDIRNTAGCGVEFIKGERCLLRRSHFHHVGATCVNFFDGGAHNEFYDNEFDHSGQLKIGGQGLGVYSHNTIVGNKVHDIGGVGFSMWSSHTLFASNEIYRTMTAMRDGGGVYGAQVHCVYRDNYCHDNGDWPGLYNDEGGRDTIYIGNVFENTWWPIHMHDCYNITVTNNTFINDGGMRYSFQGSTHCTMKDNVIKTALPVDRDPYVENCDTWSNDIQLKQKDGSYGPKQRLTLVKKLQPPRKAATAVRVKGSLYMKADAKSGLSAGLAGGSFQGGRIGVNRSRAGYDVSGVPGPTCTLGFDATNLYVSGTYEYNKLSPYFGVHNYGTTWGVSDGLRFHFKGFTVSVFFEGRQVALEKKLGMLGYVLSADPSISFSTNNAYVSTGWWGRSPYAFILPLKKLGLEGDPLGKSVPFNLEFYNGDHDEYKYFNQPNGDDILSSTLTFAEPTVDQTNLIDVKERFADGSCASPGPVWPDGGTAQPFPATCDRPGEGYKQPLGFDNHNAELVGYVLRGTPALQGFAMLPFSMKQDPSGEGRFTKKMDDSSMSVKPYTYSVRTENWDLSTAATASKDCAYLRFGYDRGGPFRVQLDAQDVSAALLAAAGGKAEVTAAESTLKDGVFEGSVTATVNGKSETLYAKMQFEPKPVAVRELKANGRPGKRYILEFLLLPQVGNVQVKAAISGKSSADAAAKFAADGAAIDFDARSAACHDAWVKFLLSEPCALKDKELRAELTRRYRAQVKKNLGR